MLHQLLNISGLTTLLHFLHCECLKCVLLFVDAFDELMDKTVSNSLVMFVSIMQFNICVVNFTIILQRLQRFCTFTGVVF